MDDGVASRGHRSNIMNPAFKVLGCNSGQHSNYKTMTCIDYAGGWRKEGEEDPVQAKMNAFMKEELEW